MRTVLALTVALAAGLVASAAVAGDYYRWKDDAGVIHYDPAPPKDHPSTLVHISGKVPEAPPAEAPKTEPAKTDPALTDTQAKVKAAVDAVNAENCRTAQKNIGYYEDKGPVNVRYPDGSTHVMTKEEREAGYQEALRQRDEYCNKK